MSQPTYVEVYHRNAMPALFLQFPALRATNAKMGLIKDGRRKAESDTRAKCRLFDQREDKVEKVEK